MIYWIFCLLSLGGIGVSLYLLSSHYRNYTDIGYSSFCALSKGINCDTVAQSAYSVFAGLPVALWGCIGYLILLGILPFARNRRKTGPVLWTLIFCVLLLFTGASIVLAYISAVYIHSYCIMCILSYGITLVLLYCAWLVHRRLLPYGYVKGVRYDVRFLYDRKKVSIPMTLGVIGLLFACYIAIPRYWELQLPSMDTNLATGETQEGYPWLGAQEPELTIVEFTDYMCFQCRKMHFFLRQLVNQYPERLRLVHRHFPLDSEYNPIIPKEGYHIGSGKMAIIALYAQLRDKFWQANDYLFELGTRRKDFTVGDVAAELDLPVDEIAGALINTYLRLRLKHDIAIGVKHGIQGTPSYIIGEETFFGNIAPDALREILGDDQ